jgi:hypothetical protein
MPRGCSSLQTGIAQIEIARRKRPRQSSDRLPNDRKPAAMPSLAHQTQRDEQRQGVECCGAAVSGLKWLDFNNK